MKEGRELDSVKEETTKDSNPVWNGGQEYEEGPWYLGKAKEEFRKRQNAYQRPDEEDPIQVLLLEIATASFLTSVSQWARDRRNAEQERDSDLGPEDYFEGALRGGNREGDTLGDITETLVLIMLCLAISVLLYVRTRIIDRLRREQDQRPEEQRQPDANQGVVPPPGDAAQNDWAVVR